MESKFGVVTACRRRIHMLVQPLRHRVVDDAFVGYERLKTLALKKSQILNPQVGLQAEHRFAQQKCLIQQYRSHAANRVRNEHRFASRDAS